MLGEPDSTRVIGKETANGAIDGSTEAVRQLLDGGVLQLTLTRSDAMNAINDPIRFGMIEAMRRVVEDPEVRVVLILAEGPRAFSVGADIKEVRGEETPVQARARLEANPWIESIARCPKPIIAAVHGFCLGGGLELALAADIRIASPGALFGLPEIDLGLLPGGGGTQRLPRLIGVARALDMMLTGDRIDARRALEYGLVTRLSASEESLAEEALALARRVAAKPPLAARFVKECCASSADLSLVEGLKRERNLFTLLLSSEDRAEATAAFREKRRGSFKGR